MGLSHSTNFYFFDFIDFLIFSHCIVDQIYNAIQNFINKDNIYTATIVIIWTISDILSDTIFIPINHVANKYIRMFITIHSDIDIIILCLISDSPPIYLIHDKYSPLFNLFLNLILFLFSIYNTIGDL